MLPILGLLGLALGGLFIGSAASDDDDEDDGRGDEAGEAPRVPRAVDGGIDEDDDAFPDDDVPRAVDGGIDEDDAAVPDEDLPPLPLAALLGTDDAGSMATGGDAGSGVAAEDGEGDDGLADGGDAEVDGQGGDGSDDAADRMGADPAGAGRADEGDVDGPATIHAFDAGSDALVVLYDAARPPPSLGVEATGDGAALLADGEVIALLPGVPTIDLAAVRLVPARA